MIEPLMWLISGLAFAATVANIYKRRWCFAVRIVTNGAQVVYTYSKGAYPTAALSLAYLGLAVLGVFKWRKEK